jgi:putative acetyltransferase
LKIESVTWGDPGVIAVRELWTEYWQSLGFSDDFQNFATELHSLPGQYAPPGGRLLLVEMDGAAAGTVGFRQLRPDACEAKRLYVRPAWRGRGIARALMNRLTEEAREIGYRYLYADTLPAMMEALDFYRRMGFAEVGPYSDPPTPGAVWLRLDIGQQTLKAHRSLLR